MKRLITAVLLLFICISGDAYADDIAMIAASLMPYIKAELKGTDAEKRINAFYAGESFKKLGAKPYTMEISEEKDVDAYWHRSLKKMYITRQFIEDTLKLDLKVSAKGFAGNKENMRRLAACITPVFVHETKHQQESAELGRHGIIPVDTRASENIAFYEEYLFLSEMQLKNGGDYYSSCTPAFKNLVYFGDRASLKGIDSFVEKIYGKNPQVFPAFNKDNIVALVGALMNAYGDEPSTMEKRREEAFKRDLMRLGIIKPGEKVLITVKDFLSTGKYNWNRISFAELDAAFQGQNALFNIYDGWFNAQIAFYNNEIQQMRRVKQISNILSLAGRGAKDYKPALGGNMLPGESRLQKI